MIRNPFTRRRFLQGSAATALLTGAAPRRRLAAAEGPLKIRSVRDIQVLDPGWMIGGTEIDLQYACLASLAVYSPGEQLGWQPSAFVDSIEQSDDTHIRFTLKPGIGWSGGFGELTAEDVKFSFERIADPANEAPWKDKWGVLDHVEVVDSHNGVIVLKQPFAPLWYTTICDGTGSILSKKAVEAAGGRFTTSFPAMCGPYRIKNWIQKQRIELMRNPDWTGPRPDFDEIHILFIEDEKAAEIAYEAGEVDYTDISLDSLARYKAGMPADSRFFEALSTAWTWMGMNTEHPKLSDIRVRQAIQRAVDVQAIIDGAYGGVAPVSHGVVPPGLIGHRTETGYKAPDPAAARALIEEAGADGLALTLKILNQTDRVTAAQIIQANLADIGIAVEIVPLDPGPFWNLGIEAEGEDWKDLQLWIMQYSDTPDPSQMTQWYVSEQVGVWNWERWKDPEFDELHRQGIAESDPEKRHPIYIRMQEIMEDTGAYVWITHDPVIGIHRTSLQPVVLPGNHPYLPWFKRA